MMGFTSTGRPSFTDHEAHDDPQGIGFAYKGQLMAHSAETEPGEDHRIKCTTTWTTVRAQDRPSRSRRSRSNDVPAEMF